MRTAEVKIYSINELSDKAKEKALNDYRNDMPYEWGEENKGVLKEFGRIFPVHIKDWSYGDYRHGVQWEFDLYEKSEYEEQISEMSGIRLLKYLWNNYGKDIYEGKYYSTKGEYINGKYTYKKRYSKIILKPAMLTGYSIGAEILKPIFKFMAKPTNNTTFSDLIDDCFDEWVKACEDDLHDFYSDERIIENMEANNDEFTEEGNPF